jgi:hypothetical protein
MASETPQAGRPAWWVYVLALALALPSVWLFGTLASLFERMGADVFSPWLGALTAAGALGALAFGFASRWPRHGALWGLLLAALTLLTMALWLGANQAGMDAALLLEVLGNLAVLAVLAAFGGRWGQRRRSQRLTLAKRPSGNAIPVTANARPTPAPVEHHQNKERQVISGSPQRSGHTASSIPMRCQCPSRTTSSTVMGKLRSIWACWEGKQFLQAPQPHG